MVLGAPVPTERARRLSGGVFALQFAALVLAMRAPGVWTGVRVAELAALASLGVLC